MEQTLEGVYRILIKYPKLLEYLKSDYFNAKMQDFANDFLSLGINNFEVTNCCKDIEECTTQDLEDFDLEDFDLEDYLEEIMENFKKFL
jgi:Tfp pilus assembly protein PilP